MHFITDQRNIMEYGQLFPSRFWLSVEQHNKSPGYISICLINDISSMENNNTKAVKGVMWHHINILRGKVYWIHAQFNAFWWNLQADS